ncbi:MAG: DUF2194 domain-containing protein [Lachnospiraceae bacterium]|nr:DUF2194 domain-containing protein [Lachnospiraceae bacterium]
MKNKSFIHIIPIAAMLLLTLFVIVERNGYGSNDKKQVGVYNKEARLNSVKFSEAIEAKKDTLVLIDSKIDENKFYETDIVRIFHDFKANYDTFDVTEGKIPDNINEYKKLVLTFQSLEVFSGDDLMEIFKWVKQGGNLMTMAYLEPENNFSIYHEKLGITSYEWDNKTIETLSVENDYLIGGNKEYSLAGDGMVCLDLTVTDDSKVFLKANNKIPVLWEKNYGDGKFVCLNMNGYGKTYRGLFATAYAMMGDYTVYPVINGSSYYIDDYPSNILERTNADITKKYKMSQETFYTDVWLKDVLSWEKEYGIIHTGALIENYGDNMKAPFKPESDSGKIKYLGNTLVNKGNELGLMGFNHMPLCLNNFKYTEAYNSYIPWESEEDMKEAAKAMYDYGKKLFPKEEFAVYVPPSNIISQEGRKVIAETLPEIKAIAASYWDGECVYEQEFEIDEYGIVNTPRIGAGCNMTDNDYMAAFSELNFHYVQTHSIYPDEAFYIDDASNIMWDNLDDKFREYLVYLNKACPDVRNLSGSDMAEAVRRFDKLSVNTYREGNSIYISLGGFYDEAYLFIRLNDSKLSDSVYDINNSEEVSIEGGSMKRVANGLYLLHATKPELKIER